MKRLLLIVSLLLLSGCGRYPETKCEGVAQGYCIGHDYSTSSVQCAEYYKGSSNRPCKKRHCEYHCYDYVKGAGWIIQ